MTTPWNELPSCPAYGGVIALPAASLLTPNKHRVALCGPFAPMIAATLAGKLLTRGERGGSSMARVAYDPVANGFRPDPDRNSLLPQVMWHITDACPLSCPYCFATKTPFAVRSEQISAIVAVLGTLGVQKVDLAGGEPLVSPVLPEIVTALSSAGISITLTTSGAGSARAREWLAASTSQFTRVILSLDGSPALHDELRGRNGTFVHLASLAGQIQERDSGRLRINTVCTSAVRGAAVEECARTVLALGPVEWCLIQPHPANAKDGYALYALSDQDFEEVVERVRTVVSSCPGAPKLLVRYAANYASYWVLYPDGQLRQHTAEAEDGPAIDIGTAPLSIIARTIADSEMMWLPRRED